MWNNSFSLGRASPRQMWQTGRRAAGELKRAVNRELFHVEQLANGEPEPRHELFTILVPMLKNSIFAQKPTTPSRFSPKSCQSAHLKSRP